MVGKDGSRLYSSLQREGQKGLKSVCLEEVTSYSAIPFFFSITGRVAKTVNWRVEGRN